MAGNEDGKETQLIGPSPNEILAKGVEDIKSLSSKRQKESVRERYDYLLQKLAKYYFMLSSDDITGLSREQKVALEYTINQKAKRFNRILLWSNIIGLSAVGILTATVHPLFLLGLGLTLINIPIIACGYESEFRYLWPIIHQNDNPKGLLQDSSENA